MELRDKETLTTDLDSMTEINYLQMHQFREATEEMP
jgi:hypothetical protein